MQLGKKPVESPYCPCFMSDLFTYLIVLVAVTPHYDQRGKEKNISHLFLHCCWRQWNVIGQLIAWPTLCYIPFTFSIKRCFENEFVLVKMLEDQNTWISVVLVCFKAPHFKVIKRFIKSKFKFLKYCLRINAIGLIAANLRLSFENFTDLIIFQEL